MKDRELFNLFVSCKNSADLFTKIEDMIEQRIQDAKGYENARFYSVLRDLSTSINNAGWEERHSSQIDIINHEMESIIDKHEDYLP
jgi:hypothetical protein